MAAWGPAASTSTPSCGASRSIAPTSSEVTSGGIDTLARALLVAAALVSDGALERARDERYAGWDGELGRRIMHSDTDLAGLADTTVSSGADPQPVSGRQEHLENEVNRIIWSTS